MYCLNQQEDGVNLLKTQGGCHCGNIRYIIESEYFIADYCHCDICRKISGAPVSAFLIVPRKDFTYTQGLPRQYASSAYAVRDFCGDCGSTLVFWRNEVNDGCNDTRFTEIAIGSLDCPEIIAPSAHFWTSRQLPWFNTDDNLPRHQTHHEHD